MLGQSGELVCTQVCGLYEELRGLNVEKHLLPVEPSLAENFFVKIHPL